MAELPSGTVTFLFTDIEGSTALWERNRVVMAPPLNGIFGSKAQHERFYLFS